MARDKEKAKTNHIQASYPSQLVSQDTLYLGCIKGGRLLFVIQPSVIRRAVGYSRHDTDNELSILNELYSYLRLYVNFFQPVRKLIKKEGIW